MRRFWVLAGCLSIGVAVFYRPAAAFAAPTAVVAIVGECLPLENDCATLDTNFVVSSVQLSVNPAGVWTTTCAGTTAFRPTRATTCKGETLNGANGDIDPQFASELILAATGAEPVVYTDDWAETITPSGHVTMTSKFNVNEIGN